MLPTVCFSFLKFIIDSTSLDVLKFLSMWTLCLLAHVWVDWKVLLMFCVSEPVWGRCCSFCHIKIKQKQVDLSVVLGSFRVLFWWAKFSHSWLSEVSNSVNTKHCWPGLVSCACLSYLLFSSYLTSLTSYSCAYPGWKMSLWHSFDVLHYLLHT